MTEIGIDAQMMSVDRTFRRKTKMMITTRTDPTSAASRTAAIELRMNRELSSSTVILMPGTSRLIRSTSTRTACAIATVFLPDCFVTCMRTPGLPLIRMTERFSSVESSTFAMSFR